MDISGSVPDPPRGTAMNGYESKTWCRLCCPHGRSHLMSPLAAISEASVNSSSVSNPLSSGLMGPSNSGAEFTSSSRRHATSSRVFRILGKPPEEMSTSILATSITDQAESLLISLRSARALEGRLLLIRYMRSRVLSGWISTCGNRRSSVRYAAERPSHGSNRTAPYASRWIGGRGICHDRTKWRKLSRSSSYGPTTGNVDEGLSGPDPRRQSTRVGLDSTVNQPSWYGPSSFTSCSRGLLNRSTGGYPDRSSHRETLERSIGSRTNVECRSASACQ